MTNLPERLQEAVYEFQQYLSDAVAPLLVADSLTLLMEYPPQVMADQIQQWAYGQYQGQSARLPISDYLFHAVKKVYLLGEFELISRDVLADFVAQLGPAILEYCPEGDRPLLIESLSKIPQPEARLAKPAEFIYRQRAPEGPTADAPALAAAAPAAVEAPFARAAVADEPARASRLLTLLLERLERDAQVAKTSGAMSQASAAMAAQILSAVAAKSTSGQALNADLEKLRQFGITGGMDSVFKTLSDGLPAWSVAGGEEVAARSGAAEAMRKLVTISDDANEAASRLHEMVKAAVEKFNAGMLGKAVTMYDIADGIIAENKVKGSIVEAIRRNGHQHLDLARVRGYADKAENHSALRRALGFYLAYGVEGLLAELQVAEKRDRRRFLLALLEVHGAAARTTLLDRLNRAISGNPARDDWHFQRNLVHLLRRTPRPAEMSADEELDPLARLADPQRPGALFKEVVAAIGQLRTEKAEAVLLRVLSRLEEPLVSGPERPPEEREALWGLLDRTTLALARLGSPNACRAVVNHGLKREARLGPTSARLTDLAALDLGFDAALLDRVLAALQEELPRKLLGVAVKLNSERLMHLIQAVSGSPAAADTLRQVAEKFPDTDFARQARKALGAPPGAIPGATPRPAAPEAASTSPEPAATPAPIREAQAAALSGDLDLFGLPTLLQSLAASRLTGALILETPKKEPLAALWLKNGKLVDAKLGGLQGPIVVYQLLERPVPATFNFLSQADSDRAGKGRELDADSVILEGLRRYDELQRAEALIPDKASFVATGATPSAPPEDINVSLVTQVWELATAGETPLEVELETNTDSYTVRRLLTHWLEEGSLRPK